MATIIPRSQIPNSQIGGLPNVRAPRPADTSALVEGAQIVNKTVQAFAAQQIERNDTAALMQARRELSDFENQTFDPNNAEGIGKYRGGNALGANELVAKADSRIGEIRSRLNPRQAAQFDAISLNFRDGLAGRLNTYMDREHSAYLKAEGDAALGNLANDAVSAGLAGDFTRQDQVGTELVAMRRRQLEVDGAGPEQIRAETEALASNIRANTALGMAADKPFAAMDYFARYADQMQPADRLKVEAVLRPVVQDAEDDATTDAILAGQQPLGSADVDEQIAMLEGTGQNPNSSARGVGQFIDSTWLETLKKHRPDLAEGKSNAELLTLKDDPTLGRELLTKFREDNARSLTARGITPNAENLYAAHHFGVGGATKFANSSDRTPMTSILSRKEISANPYLADKTVGEVKANWAQRGLRAGAASAGPSPMGVPRTEADAIAYAQQTIQDPRERKAVTAKIREKWSIRKAQEAENEKALSESAYTAISSNTDPRKPLREIIGPEAYAYAARKGSLDTLDSYRRNVLTQTLTKDDPVLADALHREAVLNPTSFQKRDLYSLVDRLSTDTLGDLVKMQKDAGKTNKQAEWATTNERIDQGYLLLGLDPSQDPKGGDKKRQQQRAAFATQYRAAERDFVQRNKREPNQTEADTLLRNITRAAAQRLAAGTLTPERLGSEFIASINERDRAEIVADFRADVGRDPTEAEIINVAATYRQRGAQ